MSTQEPETEVLDMKTDDELIKLARDVVMDKVFIDRMIDEPEEQWGNMLRMVFLPIAFGALSNAKAEQVGMVYEYYDQAGPRTVNGYPIFMSCNLIHKDQMETLIGYVKYYIDVFGIPPKKDGDDEKST